MVTLIFQKPIKILRDAEDPNLSFVPVCELDLFDMLANDYESIIAEAKNRHWTMEQKILEAKKVQEEVQTTHVSQLLGTYKETVLMQLITSFGLGPFLHNDHDGGDMDTVHNTERGVFTSDKVRESYNHDFDRKNYEKDFTKIRKRKFQQSDVLLDAYTGKELTKDGRSHLDHVVSAHEIHQNDKMRLYISDEERNRMATDDRNLAMTNSSLNQSKGDLNLMEWVDKPSTDRNGTTNLEKFGVDRGKAFKKDRDARRFLKKQLIKAQSKQIVHAGVNDGLKTGAKQAIGLILYEFIISLYKELKTFFKNLTLYRKSKTVLKEFRMLMEKVAKRVLSRRKDFAGHFSSGFISGFLSNVITSIINSFFTTVKNMVRIIREGFYSFIRAIKMIVVPPRNMTPKEAVYEASKIFAVGLITCGGIALEEALRNYLLTTPLNPIAGLISSILSGILTGIVATTVIYFMDLISLHESTNELVSRTNKIQKKTVLLQQNYTLAAGDIASHDGALDYFQSMNKSDRNINDAIDFFDE